MNETDTLRNVESYMEFWGWTDGGSLGSVKRDADGVTLASYGDTIWVADIELARDKLKQIITGGSV